MSIIDSDEWDEVIELASEYTFPESNPSQEKTRLELLDKLKILHNKYGKNTNIIASIAEYTLDNELKEALLLEAYNLSIDEKDLKDKIFKTII